MLTSLASRSSAGALDTAAEENRSFGGCTLGQWALRRALGLHEENLALYERLKDKSGVALALVNLGDVAREQCEEGPTAALYDQALVLFRELGHERGVARALVRLSAKR